MAFTHDSFRQACEQKRSYPRALLMYFALTYKGKPINEPPVPGTPGTTVRVDGSIFDEPQPVDGYVVFSENGSLISTGEFGRAFTVDRFTVVSHTFWNEEPPHLIDSIRGMHDYQPRTYPTIQQKIEMPRYIRFEDTPSRHEWLR